MKITFICGSLESGRDGVGDYTITLAKELKKSGHSISILALNDHFIQAGARYTTGLIASDIAFLRLSSTCSNTERIKVAREWLWDLQPQWLSLQFVPFSFHKKGLPVFLSRTLRELNLSCKWHIMFHELWVGMPVQASKKHIYWGWMQKQIIRKMILTLNPNIIHTQCQLYHRQLTRVGRTARLLPLCSNIPVSESNNQLKSSDHEGGDHIASTIRLVLFGTIHPQALLLEFLKQVSAYRNLYGVAFELTLVGNCGPYQHQWVSAFKGLEIPVHVFGQQTPETISHVLSTSTIGVSTSAVAMIDKSGTVAAMLAHKLPVICVGDQWQARGIQTIEPIKGIHVLGNDCITACMNDRVDVSSKYQVHNTATIFINDLTA